MSGYWKRYKTNFHSSVIEIRIVETGRFLSQLPQSLIKPLAGDELARVRGNALYGSAHNLDLPLQGNTQSDCRPLPNLTRHLQAKRLAEQSLESPAQQL
jgi:hypothetical protein